MEKLKQLIEEYDVKTMTLEQARTFIDETVRVFSGKRVAIWGGGGRQRFLALVQTV